MDDRGADDPQHTDGGVDERAALALLERQLDPVGDDAAVVDGQVLTTDMLHETTDFPDGTTRYTAGWRAVGASLSDVAAMGADATAAVAAYGAPAFDPEDLAAFVSGASDVCERVDAAYVGGDLDTHAEFTVATTVLGDVGEAGPIRRSGGTPGDVVCVTGTLGRSAAAVERFARGDLDRANDLFRFTPRVEAGRTLAADATAMMDSSDGLARSLHQLADASDCGFAIDSAAVPVAPALREVFDGGGEGDGVNDGPTALDATDALDAALTFGEDFELVATVPRDAVASLRAELDVPLAVVGKAVDAADGISLDGESLADRGYTHG